MTSEEQENKPTKKQLIKSYLDQHYGDDYFMISFKDKTWAFKEPTKAILDMVQQFLKSDPSGQRAAVNTARSCFIEPNDQFPVDTYKSFFDACQTKPALLGKVSENLKELVEAGIVVEKKE